MEQQPAQSPTTAANATTPQPRSAPRGANRCRHRSRANGRCRLPVQEPATGHCFVHSRVRKTTYPFDDTCDLSADLFGSDPHPSFETPEQITATLTNLVVLVAQGRLSPRRASVISYALSFILRGIQVIDKKAAETPQEFIIDIHSAVRDRALGLQTQTQP